jgi:hypothetical protein
MQFGIVFQLLDNNSFDYIGISILKLDVYYRIRKSSELVLVQAQKPHIGRTRFRHQRLQIG